MFTKNLISFLKFGNFDTESNQMKGYVRSVIVCFAVISGVLFVLMYYESILDMKLQIMKICNIYLEGLNQEIYIITFFCCF